MNKAQRCVAIIAAVALVAIAGCGRSGEDATSDSSAVGSALSQGDFGTLKKVCGPGPGNNTGSGIGLTPTEISIGTISDPGSSIRPGLNQEIFDASDVFVSWCNSLGGINGRQIKLDKLDAQLFQYKQRIVEACQNDFALVGGGGVFDSQGQRERVECMLPDFPAFLTNEMARASDLKFQDVPTPVNSLNIGTLRWLKGKFPQATKVAVLTGSIPSLITNAKQNVEALSGPLGMDVVYNAQYNSTGEATWVPFAQAIKASQAQGVVFIGEHTDFAKLVQAFDLVGYTPTWVQPSTNIYDEQLIGLAGPALKNVYIPGATAAMEASGAGPAQTKAFTQYTDLFKQYLPDRDGKAVLALHSFSAWLLFAESAKACGSHITRKCVVENASKIKTWDGGGLTVPSNPGGATASQCTIIVQATPTGFKVIRDGANTDESIFCSPDNAVPVTATTSDKGVKLADFGKTLNDLP